MDIYQYVVSQLGGPYEKLAMPLQLSHGLAGIPIGAVIGAGAGWLSERDNPDENQRHTAVRNGALAGAALGGLTGAVVGDYRYTNKLKAQEAAAAEAALASWSGPAAEAKAMRIREKLDAQAAEKSAPTEAVDVRAKRDPSFRGSEAHENDKTTSALHEQHRVMGDNGAAPAPTFPFTEQHRAWIQAALEQPDLAGTKAHTILTQAHALMSGY